MPSQLANEVRRAEVLTNRENPCVKQFRALKTGPTDNGCIGVESVHRVREAPSLPRAQRHWQGTALAVP